MQLSNRAKRNRRFQITIGWIIKCFHFLDDEIIARKNTSCSDHKGDEERKNFMKIVKSILINPDIQTVLVHRACFIFTLLRMSGQVFTLVHVAQKYYIRKQKYSNDAD